jgi:hypothetical protein
MVLLHAYTFFGMQSFAQWYENTRKLIIQATNAACHMMPLPHNDKCIKKPAS